MKDLDERSHLFTTVNITVTAIFVVMSLLVFIYKSMQCSETDSLGNDERLTEVLCDDRTADIGCITSDTTVALDYKIRNIGKDSLRVIFVSPKRIRTFLTEYCCRTEYKAKTIQNVRKRRSIVTTMNGCSASYAKELVNPRHALSFNDGEHAFFEVFLFKDTIFTALVI